MAPFTVLLLTTRQPVYSSFLAPPPFFSRLRLHRNLVPVSPFGRVLLFARFAHDSDVLCLFISAVSSPFSYLVISSPLLRQYGCDLAFGLPQICACVHTYVRVCVCFFFLWIGPQSTHSVLRSFSWSFPSSLCDCLCSASLYCTKVALLS